MGSGRAYLTWAGGGRVPRQPGQVGNEAALTIRTRVVCQPLSHIFMPPPACSWMGAGSPSIVVVMAKKKQSGSKRTAKRPAKARGDTSANYVVLARKYRPASFEDLIGQDAMVETLRNAFKAGRIAQAYMLTGVRGVGKTTTARILARALNFARDGKDDGPTTDLPRDVDAYGVHCTEIMESRHPDVLEMDAASNTGVDNIRELIESARYKPIIARYKVFIIDEVHMLSKGAFNALLKTLEEPPEHVKFIFATTEIRKVPVTVLSRCQRFDLRRVDVPLLMQHLKKICDHEGAAAEDEAIRLIARAAEGSVRDGLSILDQAIAFSEGSDVAVGGVRAMLGLADRGRIFDLLRSLVSGEAGEALSRFEALYKDGADPIRVLTDLAEVVHAATRVKVAGPDSQSEELSAEEQRRAGEMAEKLSMPLLARIWQMLVKGIEEGARAPNRVAAAEMVLIRIAYTADLPSPDAVIKALGETVTENANGREAVSTDGGKAGVPAGSGQAQAVVSDGILPIGMEQLPETHAEEPSPGNIEDSGKAPAPRSFAEVVQLVGARRDGKLKFHLEEHVSLVAFDATARSIDLYLLPGAPAEIANELREKLNAWTGQRWVVVLSKSPGEPPIAQARKLAKEAEIAQLKTSATVKAAFEAFPDAEIAEIRSLDGTEDGDEEAGAG